MMVSIQAPRREPGDDVGGFGMDAAISPCLRMGAFMRGRAGGSPAIPTYRPRISAKPPSTPSTWPVIQPWAGSSRNAIARALADTSGMSVIRAHIGVDDRSVTLDRLAAGLARRVKK